MNAFKLFHYDTYIPIIKVSFAYHWLHFFRNLSISQPWLSIQMNAIKIFFLVFSFSSSIHFRLKVYEKCIAA